MTLTAQYQIPEYAQNYDSDDVTVYSGDLGGGYQEVADSADRADIPVAKRAIGMIVSYDSSGVWLTERFEGSSTLNAQWLNENNWVRIISENEDSANVKKLDSTDIFVTPTQLMDSLTNFSIDRVDTTGVIEAGGNAAGNLTIYDTVKTNDILDRTGNGIQLLSDLGFFVANEAASQYFIAVDGTGAEVEINSTLMDVNAGVEVSGTAEFSGNIYQTNSATPSPTIAVSGLTISDYTYQVASATSYSFKITGSYSGSAADSAYIDITVPDDGQLKFNGNLDGIWMTTGGGVTAGDRFGIVDYAYSFKNAGGTGSWIVASNDLRNSWGDSDQLTFVFATLGGSRANIYLHEGSLSGTQGYECTFTMEFMIIDSDY